MTNKISMDKTYRTRDGRDVKIYTTEHEGDWPVVGAIGVDICTWRADGTHPTNRDADLIEVKPEKVVWVVVDDDKDLYISQYGHDEAVEYKSNYGGTLHRVTLNEDNEVK